MMFSKNLRYLRKAKEWSQEDLANKLGYKSFTTIQKWESGSSEPSVSIVKQIATIFNVDMDSLINRDLQVKESQVVSIIEKRTNKSEEKLLDLYRQLNTSGQTKVCDYTSDLVASGNYSAGFDCKLAAHDRTDVQPSAEDRQHDLDLLNSDDF